MKYNSKLSGLSVQQSLGTIHVCSTQNGTHELHISIYPLNALHLSLGKTRCNMYCIHRCIKHEMMETLRNINAAGLVFIKLIFACIAGSTLDFSFVNFQSTYHISLHSNASHTFLCTSKYQYNKYMQQKEQTT